MPESGDFLVDWRHVVASTLDLSTGQVRIELSEEYAAGENWLRGARVLVGRWIDRVQLDASSLPA